MPTALYHNNQRYKERHFTKEKDLEDLAGAYAPSLFGPNSIWINAKKKIDNKALGGTIPDAFLFDLKDPENPEFYLVEVELAKHSFYNHIFPQITKFFAFFKNPESQGALLEKLYTIIKEDEELSKAFKARIGRRELYKFLKDTLESSENILLLLDDEKKELPEIINTYTDTWGKMVKLSLLKQYIHEGQSIISLTPEFEAIDTVDLTAPQEKDTPYTEEFHLEGSEERIQAIYRHLIIELQQKIPNLKVNTQRYYISLRKKHNFAFIKIRKKKIVIVAKASEERIRQRISNHTVTNLSQSVQDFYNGPSAHIHIENAKHLQEVIDLLVAIQK